jgi:hypothetical protein
MSAEFFRKVHNDFFGIGQVLLLFAISAFALRALREKSRALRDIKSIPA